MKTTNLVLYALANGVRHPIFSLAPGDPFAAAKVAGHVGVKMNECARSGAPLPDFHVTRETREATDEGVHVGGAFEELAADCTRVLRKAGSVDELFAAIAKAKEAPAEVVEETAAAKKSKNLAR